MGEGERDGESRDGPGKEKSGGSMLRGIALF